MELDYVVLDVFAERALEGNMLAVFTDARGLTTGQMQALARETNLAETTFVLPEDEATERRDGVRVRIFTTEEELPFAGHPTLGTASWIHLRHKALAGAETVRLRLEVGAIEVSFAEAVAERCGSSAGVFGTMRQRDPVFGAVHDRVEVAGVLGLPVEAIDARFATQTVSTGIGFCVVPVRDVEALGRLDIPQAAAKAYLAGREAKFFYCIAPAGDGTWRARMQFYAGEDPATGSAAGCAISWLVRQGRVESGVEQSIVQGVEIRRPARMLVRASMGATGAVTGVHVGGRTIPVAEGRFFL